VASGHTAIVTGANHGIGAATAQALAQRGCVVLCTFLRVDDPDDPGTPQEYRDHRAQDAAAVVRRIRDGGGKAAAVEADLSDPATPRKLFDTAEEQFGPVDILVNNATWFVTGFRTDSRASLTGPICTHRAWLALAECSTRFSHKIHPLPCQFVGLAGQTRCIWRGTRLVPAVRCR
jgi:3-oxoacyl-[acyl-carrier protein] reductase